MLPIEAFNEFQSLYKNAFGIEISPEEAKVKATRLLELFKIIYKPIQKEVTTKPNEPSGKTL